MLERINLFCQISFRVVLIAPGIASSILNLGDSVECVVGIGNCIAFCVCHTLLIASCIVGIAGHSSHGIRHGGNLSIGVVRIGNHTASRIGYAGNRIISIICVGCDIAHRVRSRCHIPHGIIGVSSNASHGIRHGGDPAVCIVSIRHRVAKFISCRQNLSIGIIDVRNGASIRVRRRRNTSQLIVYILRGISTCVGNGSCAAHAVIYVRCLVAQWRACFCDLSVSVIGIRGYITQSIGFAHKTVVLVITIGSRAAISVCVRNQIAVFIIDTVRCMSHSVCLCSLISNPVIGVQSGISVCVRRRICPAIHIVRTERYAASGIGRLNKLPIGIVLIAPGIAHSICHRNHTSFSVIGIGRYISIGICCGGEIACLIVGIARRAAKRISRRDNLIHVIVDIGGNIPHPIALTGIKAVAINGVRLRTTSRICNFDQLPCRCIFISRYSSVCGCFCNQTSLLIVCIVGNIAKRVGHRCTISIVIIGISCGVPLSVCLGGKESVRIRIDHTIPAAICHPFHQMVRIILIAYLSAVSVCITGDLIFCIVAELLSSAIRINDFRNIACGIMLILSRVP